MRTNFAEQNKKFEFLAHKTVEDKKNNNNNGVLNLSSSSTSLYPSEFIGKKRENINNSKNIIISKENKEMQSKKILNCLNCLWKFPERMSIIRRNLHINKCYEGNGKLDIMKYNEEQKLKLYRNYPNKKIIDLLICPICGKDIGTENSKTKQNHLHFCSKISLIK